MNGCSFPLADSDYTNPTHQENTMNIPSVSDLFSATDNDGWTIDERIEQHINETLKTVLNPEQVDTLQLASDLTDTIVASLKVTDLNAYAHQKEA